MLAGLVVCLLGAVRVRIAFFQGTIPSHAACGQGWFDAPGYEVSCVFGSSGFDSIAKLESGGLELSALGSSPMTAAVARGVPIEAVHVLGGAFQ